MAKQEAKVHPTVQRANAAVGRLRAAGIVRSAAEVEKQATQSRKGE
jgi:hypothetical protein